MRDAGQPSVEPGTEAVQFGPGRQPPPGQLVRLIRLRLAVERLVAAGEHFPRIAVLGAQRAYFDHDSILTCAMAPLARVKE